MSTYHLNVEAGNRLQEYRIKLLNKTREQAAQDCGLPKAMYTAIESGDHWPNAETFKALHGGLGINLHWFIRGEGEWL